MCGRYLILRSRSDHEKYYKATMAGSIEFVPNYNVTPGQKLPVIHMEGEQRIISMMQWGSKPAWAKDTAPDYKINTRIETVLSGKYPIEQFFNNRCVIPAAGFYEWDKRGGQKVPYHFYPKTDDFISFAGIWEEIKVPSGQSLKTFTILTCGGDMAGIHQRAPVMFNKVGVEAWLNKSQLASDDLYGDMPEIGWNTVNTAVNNPRFNNPACIIPVEPQQPCLL